MKYLLSLLDKLAKGPEFFADILFDAVIENHITFVLAVRKTVIWGHFSSNTSPLGFDDGAHKR